MSGHRTHTCPPVCPPHPAGLHQHSAADLREDSVGRFRRLQRVIWHQGGEHGRTSELGLVSSAAPGSLCACVWHAACFSEGCETEMLCVVSCVLTLMESSCCFTSLRVCRWGMARVGRQGQAVRSAQGRRRPDSAAAPAAEECSVGHTWRAGKHYGCCILPCIPVEFATDWNNTMSRFLGALPHGAAWLPIFALTMYHSFTVCTAPCNGQPDERSREPACKRLFKEASRAAI